MIEIEFYDYNSQFVARHFLFCKNNLDDLKRYLERLKSEFKDIAFVMLYRGSGMSRSYISGRVL